MDVVTLLLLIATIAVFWKYLSVRAETRAKLPPGTMGLPFIGETFLFLNSRIKWADTRKQKYGSLYKTHILGMPTIVINDGALICDLLRQEDKLVSMFSPPTAKMVFGPIGLPNLHGAEHSQQRKWLYQIFYRPALDSYIPTLQKIFKRTVYSWVGSDQPVSNMTDKIQQLVSNTAARVIAGIEDDDLCDRLASLIEVISSNLLCFPINLPGFKYRQVVRARTELKSILRASYETRDPNATGTVLDCLRKIRDFKDPPVSNDNLGDIFVELFLTSNATLRSALSVMFLHLCQYPMMKERIKDEVNELDPTAEMTSLSLRKLSFTNAFIKESLRLATPIGALIRKLLQPLVTKDYEVPAGWTVFLDIRTLHACSPSVENPEDFQPERWLRPGSSGSSEYIPFGSGQRQCFGKSYAEVFLSSFLMEIAKYKFTKSSENDTIKYTPFPLLPDNFIVYFEESG